MTNKPTPTEVAKVMAMILCFIFSFKCEAQKLLVSDSAYANFQSQILDTSYDWMRTGLVYVRGIEWTENKKQDSVVKIFITGDTMTVVRSLLNYLLENKSEADNARWVLSHINLDILKGFFKDKYFNFAVQEYRKTVKKNNAAHPRPQFNNHQVK